MHRSSHESHKTPSTIRCATLTSASTLKRRRRHALILSMRGSSQRMVGYWAPLQSFGRESRCVSLVNHPVLRPLSPPSPLRHTNEEPLRSLCLHLATTSHNALISQLAYCLLSHRHTRHSRRGVPRSSNCERKNFDCMAERHRQDAVARPLSHHSSRPLMALEMAV